DHHDFETAAARRFAADETERFLARRGEPLVEAPCGEHMLERSAAGFVVVDNEHTTIGEGRLALRHGRAALCLFAETRGEPERRTMAGLAGHADLATHLFHELLANREAQPGATIFAGR